MSCSTQLLTARSVAYTFRRHNTKRNQNPSALKLKRAVAKSSLPEKEKEKASPRPLGGGKTSTFGWGSLGILHAKILGQRVLLMEAIDCNWMMYKQYNSCPSFLWMSTGMSQSSDEVFYTLFVALERSVLTLYLEVWRVNTGIKTCRNTVEDVGDDKNCRGNFDPELLQLPKREMKPEFIPAFFTYCLVLKCGRTGSTFGHLGIIYWEWWNPW